MERKSFKFYSNLRKSFIFTLLSVFFMVTCYTTSKFLINYLQLFEGSKGVNGSWRGAYKECKIEQKIDIFRIYSPKYKKCLYNCIATKLEFVDEKGTFSDFEFLTESFGLNKSDSVLQNIFQICQNASTQNTPKCETTYNQIKCFSINLKEKQFKTYEDLNPLWLLL